MHLIDYQIEAVTGLRQRQCLAAEGELAQIDAIRPALRSDAVKNRLRLVDGEVKTGIGNIDGNLLGSDLPIRNCQRFGASLETRSTERQLRLRQLDAHPGCRKLKGGSGLESERGDVNVQRLRRIGIGKRDRRDLCSAYCHPPCARDHRIRGFARRHDWFGARSRVARHGHSSLGSLGRISFGDRTRFGLGRRDAQQLLPVEFAALTERDNDITVRQSQPIKTCLARSEVDTALLQRQRLYRQQRLSGSGSAERQ